LLAASKFGTVYATALCSTLHSTYYVVHCTLLPV